MNLFRRLSNPISGNPARSFRKPSKKALDLARVVAVRPQHGAYEVEFWDGMSIQVHQGSGLRGRWYAMRPLDLRHEGRSPGPETRRVMQYAAISAAVITALGRTGVLLDFKLDHDGDVLADEVQS